MTSTTAPHPRKVIAALISVQVLFGINYVVSKVVVEAFPPLVWASMRIIVAATVMMSFAKSSGRKHPEGGKKFFVPLIGFALLGMIINQGSFLVGLKRTTSTNSAVLNTLIPVFTLLIVSLRGQEAATPKRILGFISAFAGVLVIRKVENLSFSDNTLFGDGLTVLNCFSYALFLSFSKRFLERNDRVWTTAWLFVYGSVGLTLLAIPDYLSFSWPEMSPMLIGCMIFAVLGGTLMTYFLNLWALAYAKSSSVALFIYFQPIIAALLAFFWLHEPITIRTLVASGLIFLGMLLGLAPPAPTPVPSPSRA